MPFAGVSTKPDFSKLVRDEVNNWLYVEMKYPKNRARLNGVLTEITSRIYMANQDEFISTLEGGLSNIWVEIIR